MTNESLFTKVLQLTQDIIIPNRPEIIQKLDRELRKKEPEFKTIRQLISKDLSLTAKIIKIANAPFWGVKKKVDSIENALFVLGLENFKSIVLTTCLRETLQSSPVSNEQFNAFTHHSIAVAAIARHFADNIIFVNNYRVDKEHAYLTGLFHDCGIILMATKFADYFDQCSLFASAGKNIVQMEEKKYRMSHAMVSCMLINKWKLPQIIIEPVLYHHSPYLNLHQNTYIRILSAILKMSEHFVSYIPPQNSCDFVFNSYIENKTDLEELKDFMKIDDFDYKFYSDKISDLVHAFTTLV